MRRVASVALWAGAVLYSVLAATAPAQQPSPTPDALLVSPVAEVGVATLPNGPLFWRIERFPTAAAARKGASRTALFVDHDRQVWRFTLGPGPTVASPGTHVASIGPVSKPKATEFLLRINRASGAPGAATPVHTHPGSEAFYVLAGSLCQRTEHGTTRLDARHAMNGHEPGMVMQLRSCGTVALDQFVMFIVDPRKPFSAPASFDRPEG